MTPIALFTSDIHVRRRIDEQYALAQIVDLAIAEEVQVVVAAGDTHDKQSNRSEPIVAFLQQIDRLQAKEIEFWYTQGQHEWDDPPWLSGHPAAFHLHKQFRQLGDFAAYGIDWQPFGKLQEELAKIPETADLLVAHQVWGDWMGDIAAPQGDFAQIPAQVRRVITGDLHDCRIEVHKNAGGEKMKVVSPGAVAMQKIDEPHEHYVILMGEDGKFEKRRLRSRPYLKMLLNDEEDLEAFIQTIGPELERLRETAADMPEKMRTPRLWLTYGHQLAKAEGRMMKAVDEHAFVKLKQLAPPERAEAARERKKARARGEAITPLSVLSKRVDKTEKPTLYTAAERLLRAEDAGDELRRWWAEMILEE